MFQPKLVRVQKALIRNFKCFCFKLCKDQTKPISVAVIPMLPGSDLLWKVHPRPEGSERFYHFTAFAMMLNEFQKGKDDNLPPNDCRFRPDVRHLEEGNVGKKFFQYFFANFYANFFKNFFGAKIGFWFFFQILIFWF